MLELRYTTWDGQSHRHRLKPGITRVGRTEDNDVRIDELTLSAHHCEFEVTEGGVVIRDLGSAGGTFVDGEWIEEQTVGEGALISLGSFLVKVVSVVDKTVPHDSAETSSTPKPHQLPDGTISCLTHSSQRAHYECSQCFGLFCQQCFGEPQQAEQTCPQCGRTLAVVDWSCLERRQEDVLWDLVPESVRNAVQHWEKFKDWKHKND